MFANLSMVTHIKKVLFQEMILCFELWLSFGYNWDSDSWNWLAEEFAFPTAVPSLQGPNLQGIIRG